MTMRSNLSSTTAALAVLVLAGCSAAYRPAVEAAPVEALAKVDKALVFGTLSRANGAAYNGYGASLQSVDDENTWYRIRAGAKETFSGKPGAFADDFSDENSSGALFAFVVEPGVYEVVEFGAFVDAPLLGGPLICRYDKDASLRFTVAGGHAYYLGEFRIAPETFELFGRERVNCSKHNWSLHDKFARDLGLLRRHLPPTDRDRIFLRVQSECGRIGECRPMVFGRF